MLSSRAFVETPTGVSKLEFSDNFESKNSAQIRIQNFTNSQFRGVNLVDCSVLYVLGGILKERLYKKDNSSVNYNFRDESFCPFKRLYLADKL